MSGDYTPLDVLSTDETVTLTFESDYALEMAGFTLQATSISENEIGKFAINGVGVFCIQYARCVRSKVNAISQVLCVRARTSL